MQIYFRKEFLAMKKSRYLFILNGDDADIAEVIPDLQFKGTTTINDLCSYSSALEVFENNKSIICSSKLNVLDQLDTARICIEVSNNSMHTLPNCIEIGKGNISKQFEDIANKYNCDIGDHKSNSSGLNGIPSKTDCAYCHLFSGSKKHNSDRIVYKSKNFYVLPTLGEFIAGYLLIIPAKHVMSIAELSNTEREEFIMVLNDIKYLLNLTYNVTNFFVWENGTGNSGFGKAKDSIVHSHVHIAPSTLSAENVEKKYGLPLKQICFNDLSQYNMHSYLLVCGNDDNTWFINNNPNVYIPRQFIRQLLAEEYNISPPEAWNWRTHPYKEFMYLTSTNILTAVKENWYTLPNRIKENTVKYLLA